MPKLTLLRPGPQQTVALVTVAVGLVLAVALAANYEALSWQLHVHTGYCDVTSYFTRPELPDAPFERHTRQLPAASATAAASSPAPVDFLWVSASPEIVWASVQSVCAFFAGTGTMHIVVPDSMHARFLADERRGLYRCSSAGRAVALSTRLWRESDVVGGFTADAEARARFPGTMRQMALKLAAASIVATPFFVVMDSDVFARRRFSAADLVIEDIVEAPPDPAGGPRRRLVRQRARTDFDFDRFRQPLSWHLEAAAALQTRLIRSTNEACARVAAEQGAEPVFLAGRSTPFALREVQEPGGATRKVHTACANGRGMTTHVTPMIFSREIVQRVLIARLEALHAGGAAAGLAGPFARPETWPPDAGAPAHQRHLTLTGARWLDVLVAVHEQRIEGCASYSRNAMRFYSWTEYSLYFVAATAAGCLDDFHAFDFGWLTSFRHSVIDPDAYDALANDWSVLFADASDPALLLIVQSWMGRSWTPLLRALSKATNRSDVFERGP